MRTFQLFSFVLILFLFAGSSCEDKIIDKNFALGQEFNFEVNKLYTSDNGQYTLIIKEISDSRCPEGVQCIWQGELTINGQWTVDGSKSPFEIHSVVSQANKQPDGYTIQIIDAKPYSKYGSSQKPEDLIITLMVKKN